jgi:hypothetical protein
VGGEKYKEEVKHKNRERVRERKDNQELADEREDRELKVEA